MDSSRDRQARFRIPLRIFRLFEILRDLPQESEIPESTRCERKFLFLFFFSRTLTDRRCGLSNSQIAVTFSVAVRDRRRGTKKKYNRDPSAGIHVMIARGPVRAFSNGSRYRIELAASGACELRVLSNLEAHLERRFRAGARLGHVR